MTSARDLSRIRREPPPFRRVRVRAVEWLTPRMVRVTVSGSELQGFSVAEAAASVRLLIPSPAATGLEIPVWDRNEFLLQDGSRPVIRTLTPLRVDGDEASMDVEIVVAHSGLLAGWATRVAPGADAAVSGPGRGYPIADDLTELVVAGDETALPAIGQLLERVPGSARVRVIVEIGKPDAKLDLPVHAGAEQEWIVNDESRPGTKLAARIESLSLSPVGRVWAAGEAAAMQRVRKHLFEVLGLPRSVATVRGYWKFGRAAPG